MITNVDCKIPSFLLTRKVFNFDNFSINSYKKENAQFTFAEKPQMKTTKQFKKSKNMDI